MAAYDLIVIGAGPGGYVCAIRASQLGLKVAVVEKRATFGGTCLNVGCIPSKALLHASELYEEAGHSFSKMGIEVKPTLDLAKMLAFKDEAVKGNTDGVTFLLRKNKVDHFHGSGRIKAPGLVEVTFVNGEHKDVEAGAIVIATGSAVAKLPGLEIDEERIVSSTGALSLPEVPRRLLVIGAGVIGLELGSVWRRLGAEVTVVEFLDRILPGTDAEAAKQLQRSLTKQGIGFKLGYKVTGIEKNGAAQSVTIEPSQGGEAQSVEADVVLVAIGRVPYTEGLGLSEAGVGLDNRGRVVVDVHYQSSVPGIYAIGDVIAGPMLAHKAEDEGMAVAEILAGQAGHVNYGVIPGVVYTAPEARQRRQVGRRAESGGHRLQGRQVPVHRQRPGEGEPGDRRFGEDPRRRGDRSCARRTHRRCQCLRDDRRGGGADGVRRLGRGSRPHLPRASHPHRGGEGSRARRRQARHSFLMRLATPLRGAGRKARSGFLAGSAGR